jgi:predicted nucleotidyltransferase
MIDISQDQLQTIKAILKRHVPDYEVRAFGSRFTWTAKDYSDLDLAIVGPEKLPFKELSALKTAFEESDLSFRVDVLDWRAIRRSFKR